MVSHQPTKKPKNRWVRRTISFLIDTGPVNDSTWRWSLAKVLGLVAPGSVPLAFMMLGVQTHVLSSNYGVLSLSPLLGIMPALALLLSRFYPLSAWALSVLGFSWTAVLVTEPGREPWPWPVISMMSLWVVQFAVARRRQIWVSVSSLVVAIAYSTVIGNLLFPDHAQNIPLVAVFAALSTVLGIAVRSARNVSQRLAEEEALTAAERAQRNLLEERTRIARELHDVVAHHMSVITVQSSTAEYRIANLPSQALEEFRSISDQARESLTELRRLLAVLRSDDDVGLLAPQPGLDHVDSLVDSARRAGLTVDVSIPSLPTDLSEPVSLTAYRILQEALSNVVRHAPGSTVALTATIDNDTLDLTVINEAPKSTLSYTPDLTGAGLGLAGMRERVNLLSGRLSAQATESGGFEIRAQLPVTSHTSIQEFDT